MRPSGSRPSSPLVAKNAELCLDPFHIVAWATKALDEVRREVWNAARKGGQKTVAKDLKNARFALWKNPGDLTDRQACTLAGIAKTNAPLYRAYLLKEQLRQVFQLKGAEGIALLDAWLKWAWRCRLPAFVKLARSIRDHRAGIDAALSHGLSNARVESVNTKLRLLTRIAFGFRSPDALVALAMLDLGGLLPTARPEVETSHPEAAVGSDSPRCVPSKPAAGPGNDGPGPKALTCTTVASPVLFPVSLLVPIGVNAPVASLELIDRGVRTHCGQDHVRETRTSTYFVVAQTVVE